MKSEVIKRVCNLPLDFKRVDKSPFTLAHESGILELKDQISIEDLKLYIEKNSDLLKAWERWSEDKKTSFGYFLSLNNSSSIIGALDTNGSIIFKKHFTTEVDATAEYILREVFGILGKKFKHSD